MQTSEHLTMLPSISLVIISAVLIEGLEDESSDINRIENGFLPSTFLDTIVYNDIADILNEFDNNGFQNILETTGTDSDSDDDLEDLLSEYQHYLDKAYKQRKMYFEKNRTKTKTPREPFSKFTPIGSYKYFYPYNSPMDITPKSYDTSGSSDILHAYRLFKSKIFSPFAPHIEDTNVGNQLAQKSITDDYKNDLRATGQSTFDPLQSSCFCKSNQIPCDCGCKQCLVPIAAYNMPMSMSYGSKKILPLSARSYVKPPSVLEQSTENFNNQPDILADHISDQSDNTVNIKIKVQVQLPTLNELIRKHNCSKHIDLPENKELNALSVPSLSIYPYYSYSLPSENNLLKKKQHDNTLHRLSLHRKRKPRLNSNNKKHKKKVVTYHSFKLDTNPNFKLMHYANKINHTGANGNGTSTVEIKASISNVTDMTQEINETGIKPPMSSSNVTKTTSKPLLTEPDLEPVSQDILNTSSHNNITEDIRKLENNIESETEYVNTNYNITDDKLVVLIRKRRETADKEKKIMSNLTEKLNEIEENKMNRTKSIPKSAIQKIDRKVKLTAELNKTEKVKTEYIIHKKEESTTNDKSLLSNSELLYWPSLSNKAQELSKGAPENITIIILERENKKAKLNISKESLRNDHIKALEKAIFGDVDWDDIDTVVPVFMSFIGKYLTGALTFCSPKVCHSIKCGEKMCIHRVCAPDERVNHKGHCAGSNKTDSIASLESILDLPSNVANEIVDILEEKMLGKIFGEATLCINTKCISFAAVKKNFLKVKCSVKDLSPTGHCPNVKKV